MTDSVMQGVAEGMLAGTVLTNLGSAGTRAAQIEILLKQVELAEDRADKAEKRARKAEDENEMLRERVEQLENQLANQTDIGLAIAHGPVNPHILQKVRRENEMGDKLIDANSALRAKEKELHIKEQEFLEFFAANGGLKKVIRNEVKAGQKNEEQARREIDDAIIEFAAEQEGKLDNTTTVKAAVERKRTGSHKPI